MPLEGHSPLIYKYRSVSSERSREALSRVIQQSELYWQHPKDFNDPFDCAPRFIFGNNERERRVFRRDLVMRKSGWANRRTRKEMERILLPIQQDKMRELAQNSIHQSIVTCFSSTPSSLLMWSHYAEEHRGVCLRFQQLTERRQPFIAFPVEYCAERPIANLTRMRDSQFFKQAVLTKAKCWEYEQEHRMIEGERAEAGYRRFPKSALTGVFLGARMDEGRREEILEELRKYRADLEILQTEFDDISYKLNSRSI